MSAVEILGVIVFLIAGAIFTLMAQTIRGRIQTERGIKALNLWAKKNRFKIISFERRFYKLGPLRIFSYTSTLMFRVKILDDSSTIRNGMVRIGNWLGDLPNEVEVIWDDENRRFQWW